MARALLLVSCIVATQAQLDVDQSDKSLFLEAQRPTVLSFIGNTPYLKTFASLISKTTDLSNITVFAPTDEALQTHSSSVLERLLNDPDYELHLQDFVEYHIVPGYRKVAQPSILRTLAIENVILRGGMSNPMVGSNRDQFSNILHEDMEQSDGIIHTINKPLFPFWFDYSLDNVVSALNDQFGQQCTIFQRMMESTGIVHLRSKMTLLVPVDQAIPPNLEQRLFHPRNTDLLDRVVQNLMVPGILNPKSTETTTIVDTLSGGQLSVTKTSFGISFDSANATNYVLLRDGIAFPINAMLLPQPMLESTQLEKPVQFIDLLSSPPDKSSKSIFVPQGLENSLGESYLRSLRDQQEYGLHRKGLVGYHSTTAKVDDIARQGTESLVMEAGGTVQAYRYGGQLFLRSVNNEASRVLSMQQDDYVVISRPLLPAWITWNPWSYMNDFESRFPSSSYRYFIELLVTADMESLLQVSDENKLTVLAPENNAISWGVRMFFLYMPENLPALRDLLNYHIVPDLINYETIGENPIATQLIGEHLSVSKKWGFGGVRALSYSLTGRHSILYRMEGLLVPPTIHLPSWVFPDGPNPLPRSSGVNPDRTATRFQEFPIVV